MADRLRNSLYATVIVGLAVALMVIVASAPAPSDRVEVIGSQIKCPVCQGESIANSPSQMARDMMDLVRARVDSGATDEEIVAELLESYSGALLLDPPPSGGTLVLWLAPLAGLVAGAGVIVWWRRHPGDPVEAAPAPTGRRSLAGGIVLAGVMAAVVVAAGFSLQDRVGPAAGVASIDEEDLALVSNETLEAVIAANLDHPDIDGMRLALAARYVEVTDYSSALDHYLAVADSENAEASEVLVALIQMGRLVWDGNGDAELAIQLFDEALAIDPDSPPALYHKAVVLWCGRGDAVQAAGLLETLLTSENASPLAEAAAADLKEIRDGQECT